MISTYRRHGWNDDRHPFSILGLTTITVSGKYLPMPYSDLDAIHEAFKIAMQAAREKNDIQEIQDIKKAYRFAINPGKMAIYNLFKDKKGSSLLPNIQSFIYPYQTFPFNSIDSADNHVDVDVDKRDAYFSGVQGNWGKAAFTIAAFAMIPYAVVALCFTPIIALVSLINGILRLSPSFIRGNFFRIDPYRIFQHDECTTYDGDDNPPIVKRLAAVGEQLLKVAFSPCIAFYAMIMNAPKVYKSFVLRLVSLMPYVSLPDEVPLASSAANNTSYGSISEKISLMGDAKKSELAANKSSDCFRKLFSKKVMSPPASSSNQMPAPGVGGPQFIF